uniref:PUL domain-containing protein n=1 Tax=Chromera velia CCMP2878 TaxID=1169474 RepID=A0A0G4G7Y8_9ALVE|eukprot:Cvel_20587.t1-p1 / transcript=Cvel_20587.t1 / gene=Cvel_20587 / organism=Chromera_velia_CCMP2878 / gene_product=hypothetical protein / transcript_product=hypothetical protein / location=Cvel_scaffold1860:21046-27988(+) / protein_length=525 / sequence_SO=supercontig / SO=protein_coding / is_pseudo=false
MTVTKYFKISKSQRTPLVYDSESATAGSPKQRLTLCRGETDTAGGPMPLKNSELVAFDFRYSASGERQGHTLEITAALRRHSPAPLVVVIREQSTNGLELTTSLDQFHPFFCISLPIHGNSLESSLEASLSPEEVEGKGTKTITIQDVGPMTLIHFKRTLFDQKPGQAYKGNRVVEIPQKLTLAGTDLKLKDIIVYGGNSMGAKNELSAVSVGEDIFKPTTLDRLRSCLRPDHRLLLYDLMAYAALKHTAEAKHVIGAARFVRQNIGSKAAVLVGRFLCSVFVTDTGRQTSMRHLISELVPTVIAHLELPTETHQNAGASIVRNIAVYASQTSEWTESFTEVLRRFSDVLSLIVQNIDASEEAVYGPKVLKKLQVLCTLLFVSNDSDVVPTDDDEDLEIRVSKHYDGAAELKALQAECEGEGKWISAVLEDIDARGEQVDSDSDVGDGEGSNDEGGGSNDEGDSELSNDEEEESDEEEEEEAPRHSYSTANRRSRSPAVSSDVAEQAPKRHHIKNRRALEESDDE